MYLPFVGSAADPGEDIVSFVYGIAMLVDDLSDHFTRMYRLILLKFVKFEKSKHRILLLPSSTVYLEKPPHIASVRHTDILRAQRFGSGSTLYLRIVLILRLVVLCLQQFSYLSHLNLAASDVSGTSFSTSLRLKPSDIFIQF